MSSLQLSIITPVLNEGAFLTEFLEGLCRQEHVDFELILCDGGSKDATLDIVHGFKQRSAFPLQLVSSPPGRACQMNIGSRAAVGEWLLFLHADSLFEQPQALMLALAAMQRERSIAGHENFAGHFPLRFERTAISPSLGYFFYEAKSRLDIPDCIHGDQGYLMHRSFYRHCGDFNEELPFLEDSEMADRVAKNGYWLLLPAEITTSARRFETEGLLQRQTLNALIMNFRHIGWDAFFTALPNVYRSQTETEKLALLPYWLKVRELFAREPIFERLRIWYATGRYVRSQAWQLTFAWHCRRQFQRGQVATMGAVEIAESMRGFERTFSNPLGNALTALLVFCWFYLSYAHLLARHFRR